MFDTSKDLFWGALAAAIAIIGVGSGFVLYRVSELLKESKKTIEDVNKKMERVNPLFDEGVPVVSSFIKTLGDINNNLLKPVVGFAAIFRSVREVADRFINRKPKQ